MILAGDPILKLVETEVLEAWIGVPPEAVQQVLKVPTHSLTVGGNSLEAEVLTVIPELDPQTRTQTVIFRFRPEAVTHVVPAQVVRIELSQTLDVDGFRIPRNALVRGRRGLWAVFVFKASSDQGGTVQRRDVEVLHSEGDWVVVRGALAMGDRIVTEGPHRLANDQPVVLDTTAVPSASL